MTDLALGLAASVPLYALFQWMLRSSLAPLARLRQLMSAKVCPLMAPWSLLQLGIVSILAGVCEEVLFRSVIQGTLSTFIGPDHRLAERQRPFWLRASHHPRLRHRGSGDWRLSRVTMVAGGELTHPHRYPRRL